MDGLILKSDVICEEEGVRKVWCDHDRSIDADYSKEIFQIVSSKFGIDANDCDLDGSFGLD